MKFYFLLSLGVLFLSFGLRTLPWGLLRKLGAIGFLAAFYLLIYSFTQSWPLSLIACVSWPLALPWLEILTRVRHLRLPLRKTLRFKAPPTEEEFPELDEITKEIEKMDFVHLRDVGWDWADYSQFFRLFYHKDRRIQASICFNQHDNVSFFYLSVSSRQEDGTIWTATNYPFSNVMKTQPEIRMHRRFDLFEFEDIYESHRDFLAESGVSAESFVELEPEMIQEQIESDMRRQLLHNVNLGLLVKTDEEEVKYSVKGMFFVWGQAVKDIVRLS